MHESTIGVIQSPLQVDLDRIADEIVDSLNVDIALLSFQHNRSLVSLGLSASFGRTKDKRTHIPRDMICGKTIARDAPYVLEDARADPEVRDVAYVDQLGVVGYLGVPIRNAEIGAIGAVCAITSKPRRWADSDLKYLKAISLSVENMILREMYRLESANASNLASEYDQIIAAFSLVRADPTSIHDASGRLVFANKALTKHIDDSALQSRQVMEFLRSKTGISAKIQVRDGATFVVKRQRTSSGHQVCQWTPSGAHLN